MTSNLIQSISEYATTLEQKISALEQRVALLEDKLDSTTTANAEAIALISTLQAQIAALSTASMVAQSTEPEVEIELIVDDTELSNESTILDEKISEEPTIDSEQATPSIVLEPLVEDPLTNHQMRDEVTESVEETQKEQTLEISSEPIARQKPTPTQTSLFGPPVGDIRQAISLGDRFLFQRELFGGNGELMQKTLDEINTLGSYDEAIEYVQENFGWDRESTAVQLFENVLKRRFS